MNKATKSALGLVLLGWLGMGATQAMAGAGGYCPPAPGFAPAKAAFRAPVRPYYAPAAYRMARPMPPIAMAPRPRPMPAWGVPGLASRSGWMTPVRAQAYPSYPPPAGVAYGVVQRPPVQPGAVYPTWSANPRPMPQQAYQGGAVEPLQGRHWVAAR